MTPGSLFQWGCTCGAVKLADGSWGRLAGLEGYVVDIVTFEGDRRVLHRASHGLCPDCAAAMAAEIAARRKAVAV